MDNDEDFKNQVKYFWKYKGDVERYCYWNEDRCAKVWPAFFVVWKQQQALTKALDELTGSA